MIETSQAVVVEGKNFSMCDNVNIHQYPCCGKTSFKKKLAKMINWTHEKMSSTLCTLIKQLNLT